MDDDWRPPTEAELKVIEARRERNDKISSIMGGYLLRGYKMLGETCDVCDTILLETRQGVKYCVACQEVDVQETFKDDPVMNEQAARRLCQEHSTPTAESQPSSPARNSAQNASSRQDVSVQQTGVSSASEDFTCADSGEGRRGFDAQASAAPRQPRATKPSEISTARTNAQAEPPTPDGALRNGPTASPSSSTTHTRDEHRYDGPRLPGIAEIITAKIQWATIELESETRDLTRCSLLAQLIKDCSEALTTVYRV